MNFHQKNVLITGASSGIGEALALSIAKEAAAVILVARRRDKLEQISQQLRSINHQVTVLILAKDITDTQHQAEIIRELQQRQIAVDILINNAGVGNDALFQDAEWQKLQKMIELNITSLTCITHLLLPQIIKRKGGVVFIGSGAGIAWMPGSITYSASKHYITALAMGLYAELKPLGVQVSLVCPGPVESEFNQAAGIEGGLKGGPSTNMLISAEECARDIVKGVQKGKTLIFPGKKLRFLMKAYINFPWFIRKKFTESEGKKIVALKTAKTDK